MLWDFGAVRHPGLRCPQPYGCVVVLLYGCVVVLLYGCVVVLLHGCVVVHVLGCDCGMWFLWLPLRRPQFCTMVRNRAKGIIISCSTPTHNPNSTHLQHSRHIPAPTTLSHLLKFTVLHYSLGTSRYGNENTAIAHRDGGRIPTRAQRGTPCRSTLADLASLGLASTLKSA